MKASQIKFGVEIECNIPISKAQQFPRGSYHRGEQIEIFPQGWNCQRDGSVNPDPGYFSAEVVSPILKGEDGLIELTYVADTLAQIGCITNSTCGLHVHVGTDRFTQQQYERLITLFKRFELAFYVINGDHTQQRYNSTFCSPSTRWREQNGLASRYQSLNLQHIEKARPHIEIRVWAGTVDAELIVAAVCMAVSLVARASEEDNPQDAETPTTIEDFIRSFLCNPNYLIVPDITPEDIFNRMTAQASAASR